MDRRLSHRGIRDRICHKALATAWWLAVATPVLPAQSIQSVQITLAIPELDGFAHHRGAVDTLDAGGDGGRAAPVVARALPGDRAERRAATLTPTGRPYEGGDVRAAWVESTGKVTGCGDSATRLSTGECSSGSCPGRTADPRDGHCQLSSMVPVVREGLELRGDDGGAST